MDPEMIYLGFTLTSTTARLNVFDQSLAQVKSNYNIATRDIQSFLGNTMSAETGRQITLLRSKDSTSLDEID